MTIPPIDILGRDGMFLKQGVIAVGAVRAAATRKEFYFDPFGDVRTRP